MNAATETRDSFRRAAGSSMMEAAGAVVTIALAIVGLAGVNPQLFAAIAVIVFGAAILVEGKARGPLFAPHAQLEAEPAAGSGGLSLELLGGLTGVILGVLALLGVAPIQLLTVSAIVFGAAFLLSGWAPAGKSWFSSSSGGLLLVGLTVVVLGILAAIGQQPLTLVLVSLLILGAAVLFGGTYSGLRHVSKLTSGQSAS